MVSKLILDWSTDACHRYGMPGQQRKRLSKMNKNEVNKVNKVTWILMNLFSMVAQTFSQWKR